MEEKYITLGIMFESGNRLPRARRPFRFSARYKHPKSNFSFPAVLRIIFIVFSCNKFITAAQTISINVGAIINDYTRIDKEMKVSMIVAAKKFNGSSAYQKISLHFLNPGGDPLQAAFAAEELIKKKDAKVIIGMETWEETALVADVAKQAQVPIISFATSATTQHSVPNRWPSLIQMASNVTEQIRCIASILQSFGWRKVISICEVDSYGSESGVFSVLSEALHNIGAEIEYHVVLPPFSSLSDPEAFVSNSLANILSKQSRVFIVHLSSFSHAVHLFREAKRLRLFEKDSAWIVTEPIASLLHSVNSSVKENMDGSLGIRTYFFEESRSFLAFKHDFEQIFRSQNPEEENSEIGIHALRAYDGISAIANAIKSTNSSNISSTMLAKTILSSNFIGLSGHVTLYDGKLSQASIFQIINVIGTGYKKLGFWSSELGFLNNLSKEESTTEVGGTNMNVLTTTISWPGDLTRVPNGWSMPSDVKPMKIGIPSRSSFEKFVKVTWNGSTHRMDYSGFCIDVFYEVLQIVQQKYPLPHDFVPFSGTYDELVHATANKTFDAVIGDVTILANRSKYVDFTLPFAESGLKLVVKVKSPEETKSLKPFTWEMWAVTAAILIYTVWIVWLLERRTNPEFEGPFWNQISTALWFTCSPLFFAHRKRFRSNYTRAVALCWLFVVLVLTSNYIAKLCSMLTVPRLEPNVTDIEFLKKTNATVGCDGNSFVRKYLEDMFQFKPENIKNISTQDDYLKEFKSGNITAAFLELPYEKAFLNHYCEEFTVAEKTTSFRGDRFGGLGFVFQKGSPIATDVSQAIMILTENGRLKQLEIKYFSPSPKCSETPEKVESLDWRSFLGLYLFFIGSSTFCYMLFIIHQVYKRWFKTKDAN